MGTKNDDTCLDKAAENEPLFVLRAQDKSAAINVIYWIACNLENCSKEKLREAFEQALKMRDWPTRRVAD